MSGLSQFTPDIAEPFGRRAAKLNLDGLESVSRESVEQLCKHGGRILSLTGLEFIDPKLASTLVKYNKGLPKLAALQELSPETARILSQPKSYILSLDGLRKLQVEVAAELAKFKGRKLVIGARDLTPSAMSELAKWEGATLTLPGLGTINTEQAKAIIGWKTQVKNQSMPVLELPNVYYISNEAIGILADWNGIVVVPNYWLRPKIIEARQNG